MGLIVWPEQTTGEYRVLSLGSELFRGAMGVTKSEVVAADQAVTLDCREITYMGKCDLVSFPQKGL